MDMQRIFQGFDKSLGKAEGEIAETSRVGDVCIDKTALHRSRVLSTDKMSACVCVRVYVEISHY